MNLPLLVLILGILALIFGRGRMTPMVYKIVVVLTVIAAIVVGLALLGISVPALLRGGGDLD